MENQTIGPFDEERMSKLIEAYRDVDRHHHGLSHLNFMMALMEEFFEKLHRPLIVLVSIWLHDVIYNSKRHDNEEQSAEYARTFLAGLMSPEDIDMVCLFIMATKTHEVPEGVDDETALDVAYLLDFDVAIVGATPVAYDIYEENVRKEYEWVGTEAWKQGRADFIRGFLKRSMIFKTPVMQDRFEAQARANLYRSLAQLEQSV